jgi:hypothetical protein
LVSGNSTFLIFDLLLGFGDKKTWDTIYCELALYHLKF